MLIEQPELPQLEMRSVQGGYAEGRWTNQGFEISRLCSTDPAMYLKSDYSPGAIQKL